MSGDPSQFEQKHYEQLVGRTVTGLIWDEIDGEAVPVLLFAEQDGKPALSAGVTADPEGNGPGFLDIRPD